MMLVLLFGCTAPDPGKSTSPDDSGTRTDTATPPETGTPTLPCDPDATGIAAWLNDCDGDGFDWYSDCNDADASINGEADEVCDDRDNNCDGQVDNIVADYVQDVDGDGWGNEATHTDHCPGEGSGWMEDRGWGYDCNDADPQINPDWVDTPGDGVDQDCIAGDACGTVTKDYVGVDADDASLAAVADLCGEHDEVDSLEAGLGGDVTDLHAFDCFCRVDTYLIVSAADDTRSLAGIGALLPTGMIDIGGHMTTMNGWDATGDLEPGLRVDSGYLESFAGMEAVTGLGALGVGNEYGYSTTFPGLRDLSGLDGLQHVGDSVILGELSDLTSLHGLESLDEVGYDLDLHALPALTDFSALSKLRRVGNSFRLPENGTFQSLEGLQGLEEVGLILDIPEINVVDSSFGFEGLRSVGALWISGPFAPGLAAFPGLEWNTYLRFGYTEFPDLTPLGYPEAAEELVLSYASTSLEGLENLRTVSDDLAIAGDYTDLDALSNLTEVGGDLTVWVCPSLTSLSALHGVTRVGGRIEVSSNASLPASEVEALLLAIGRENIGGTVTVYDNGG